MPRRHDLPLWNSGVGCSFAAFAFWRVTCAQQGIIPRSHIKGLNHTPVMVDRSRRWTLYSAWVCSLGSEGSHADPTIPRQVIHDSMQLW